MTNTIHSQCSFYWPEQQQRLTETLIARYSEAIDGTEPLYDVIQQKDSRFSPEDTIATMQQVTYGVAIACRRIKKEKERRLWQERLVHIFRQYFLQAAGLQHFSEEEKSQFKLLRPHQQAFFLQDRATAVDQKTAALVCEILGLTQKRVTLSVLMETQVPSQVNSPDFTLLLEQAVDWDQNRIVHRELDALAQKIFPRIN